MNFPYMMVTDKRTILLQGNKSLDDCLAATKQ